MVEVGVRRRRARPPGGRRRAARTPNWRPDQRWRRYDEAGVNWNQPICDHCWAARKPNRVPVRVVYRQRHSCAFCGHTTHSGIYVRTDPHSVPFPRRDTEREQR